MSKPIVAVVMGSQSDWTTMVKTSEILDMLSIPYEVRIISAHRTPLRLYKYAEEAEKKGLEVIIAGAGGAAHLPGMLASLTHLPVLGIPIGLDSLLSIVQIPFGIPVGTLSVGEAGAGNAALLAAAFLANNNPDIRKSLMKFRKQQTEEVPNYVQ